VDIPCHSNARRLIRPQTAVHREETARLKASQVVLDSRVSTSSQRALYRDKVDEVSRCSMPSKGVLVHELLRSDGFQAEFRVLGYDTPR
jgi:hypothetical protein